MTTATTRRLWRVLAAIDLQLVRPVSHHGRIHRQCDCEAIARAIAADTALTIRPSARTIRRDVALLRRLGYAIGYDDRRNSYYIGKEAARK